MLTYENINSSSSETRGVLTTSAGYTRPQPSWKNSTRNRGTTLLFMFCSLCQLSARHFKRGVDCGLVLNNCFVNPRRLILYMCVCLCSRVCTYKCAFRSDNVLLAAFGSDIKMFLILFEIPFLSIQLENSLIIKIEKKYVSFTFFHR